MKRVLIIGAGGIVARHVEALQNIETVKITGVCDIVRERAEAISATLEIESGLGKRPGTKITVTWKDEKRSLQKTENGLG